MAILTRGERFKDARIVHNQHGKQTMKTVELATGVSASLITELERTDRSVGYDKVAALAKHYGVSADWLLGLTEDHKLKPCATDSLGLSEQAVQAIENIRTLNNADTILAGLNIILESANIVFIAQEIMMLKNSVRSQIDHAKQIKTTQNAAGIPMSTTQKILLSDIDTADSLKEELEKLHPELANRISVACGQSALDITLQTITESFATSIKMATGYFDYQLKTID